MMLAAARNDPSVAEALIEHGAKVNALVKDGRNQGFTALMGASSNNNSAMVDMLIDHGAEVNARVAGGPKEGVTALMVAAAENDEAVVESLIARGADINARDSDGRTALIYAVLYNDPAMVKTLIGHGVDLNVRKDDGATPLMIAADEDQPEIVQSLIENGADVNARSHSSGRRAGWTPLHYAARRDNPNRSVVVQLLNAGADPTLEDQRGRVAAEVAPRRAGSYVATEPGDKSYALSTIGPHRIEYTDTLYFVHETLDKRFAKMVFEWKKDGERVDSGTITGAPREKLVLELDYHQDMAGEWRFTLWGLGEDWRNDRELLARHTHIVEADEDAVVESSPPGNALWIELGGDVYQVGLVMDGDDVAHAVFDEHGRALDMPEDRHQRLAWLFDVASIPYLEGRNKEDLEELAETIALVEDQHYTIHGVARVQEAMVELGVVGTTAFFTGGTVVVNSLSNAVMSELTSAAVDAPRTLARNWGRAVLLASRQAAHRLSETSRRIQRQQFGQSASQPLSEDLLVQAHEDVLRVDIYAMPVIGLLRQLQPEPGLFDQVQRLLSTGADTAVDASLPPAKRQAVTSMMQAGRFIDAMAEGVPAVETYRAQVAERRRHWEESTVGVSFNDASSSEKDINGH